MRLHLLPPLAVAALVSVAVGEGTAADTAIVVHVRVHVLHEASHGTLASPTPPVDHGINTKALWRPRPDPPTPGNGPVPHTIGGGNLGDDVTPSPGFGNLGDDVAPSPGTGNLGNDDAPRPATTSSDPHNLGTDDAPSRPPIDPTDYLPDAPSAAPAPLSGPVRPVTKTPTSTATAHTTPPVSNAPRSTGLLLTTVVHVVAVTCCLLAWQ